MDRINRRWLLAGHPNNRAVLDSDFEWNTASVAAPGPGEALVRNLYLGFEPAMKGHMENIRGYHAPMQLGDVMHGKALAEVVESNIAGLAPGDKVSGETGWQDYAIVAAGDVEKIEDDDLLAENLGPLGATGMTAYFGLTTIARPAPGDTVAITGAAGGVGTVVGQIAKLAGCRVIGIAGGEEKCRWLTEELGFDAAVDYKAPDVRRRIRSHAPREINVVWDNVGGELLDTLLVQLANGARVIICGAISRYEAEVTPPGPKNYFNIVFKRASMHGLRVTDYEAQYPLARERIKAWIREGKIKTQNDIQNGLENAPATFRRLFTGANRGKQLLKIA